MSIDGPNKSKRGRPVADTEALKVRIQRADIAAIDAASADEPDTPSRHEMVRRIIRDWLIGHGYLPAPSESDDN